MKKPVFPSWFSSWFPPQKPIEPSKTILVNGVVIKESLEDGTNLGEFLIRNGYGDIPVHRIEIDVEYGFYEESDHYYLKIFDEVPNPTFDAEYKKYEKDYSDWQERVVQWDELKTQWDAYENYKKQQQTQDAERKQYEKLKAKFEK